MVCYFWSYSYVVCFLWSYSDVVCSFWPCYCNICAIRYKCKIISCIVGLAAGHFVRCGFVYVTVCNGAAHCQWCCTLSMVPHTVHGAALTVSRSVPRLTLPHYGAAFNAATYMYGTATHVFALFVSMNVTTRMVPRLLCRPSRCRITLPHTLSTCTAARFTMLPRSALPRVVPRFMLPNSSTWGRAFSVLPRSTMPRCMLPRSFSCCHARPDSLVVFYVLPHPPSRFRATVPRAVVQSHRLLCVAASSFMVSRNGATRGRIPASFPPCRYAEPWLL